MRSRLSTRVACLLHCAAASGFTLSSSGTFRSSTVHARSATTLRANEFDVWWEQRRARNTLHSGKKAHVAASLETLPLNRDSVVLVVSQFVQSDYCRACCNRLNVDGTDYGQIEGMFEYVQIAEPKLVLKVKRTFGERNTALLDRLTRYLRARIPAIKEIHAMHREGRDIY